MPCLCRFWRPLRTWAGRLWPPVLLLALDFMAAPGALGHEASAAEAWGRRPPPDPRSQSMGLPRCPSTADHTRVCGGRRMAPAQVPIAVAVLFLIIQGRVGQESPGCLSQSSSSTSLSHVRSSCTFFSFPDGAAHGCPGPLGPTHVGFPLHHQ